MLIYTLLLDFSWSAPICTSVPPVHNVELVQMGIVQLHQLHWPRLICESHFVYIQYAPVRHIESKRTRGTGEGLHHSTSRTYNTRNVQSVQPLLVVYSIFTKHNSIFAMVHDKLTDKYLFIDFRSICNIESEKYSTRKGHFKP